MLSQGATPGNRRTFSAFYIGKAGADFKNLSPKIRYFNHPKRNEWAVVEGFSFGFYRILGLGPEMTWLKVENLPRLLRELLGVTADFPVETDDMSSRFPSDTNRLLV